MRSVLSVLPLIATALSSSPAAASVSRCSLVPVPSSRQESKTFFIARAQPDTVVAGPGSVKHHRAPGHYGRPNTGPIFGQVLHVGQLAGNAASALELAFARLAARRVIVVPWDYDAGCRPVAWGRSARWVEAADSGFYRVTLRPESEWIDGTPVFDAFAADLEPYPHGLYFRRGYHGTDALHRGPSLTPEQYFRLYAALPGEMQMELDLQGAARSLEAWERSNPKLVTTYPAPQVLRYAWMRLGRR